MKKVEMRFAGDLENGAYVEYDPHYANFLEFIPVVVHKDGKVELDVSRPTVTNDRLNRHLMMSGIFHNDHTGFYPGRTLTKVAESEKGWLGWSGWKGVKGIIR